MDRLWLIERFNQWAGREAMVWRDRTYAYDWLLRTINDWRGLLVRHRIAPTQVVAIEGDYSPHVCALLLVLMENNNIIVPITSSVESKKIEYLEIAQVEQVITFDEQDRWQVRSRSACVDHPLLLKARERGTPGLVLFSSGSTGASKASLHDFANLLAKHRTPRQAMRTLTFLLFDHIGGINTLSHTLANGGTTISIEDRDPDTVCRAIQRHRVELLPTSPSFLNLMLISEVYLRYDLSSLKLITYGTEPMPATTLRRLNDALPAVRFKQTYGLSELGILHSHSKESNSLWVKVGGEGFETKVVDNVLWIRAGSAMMGYLNAPTPFDEDGWFNTGDVVEAEGEYIRILGRKTEIINVGGEKVYPAEVEGVLMQLDNVRDVTVRGKSNPILGHIVSATFNLFEPESRESLQRRIREFCTGRLEPFKVPVLIDITDDSQYSQRFKKMRSMPLIAGDGVR